MNKEIKNEVKDIIDKICYKNKCENRAGKIYKLVMRQVKYYESLQTKKVPLINTIIAASLYLTCNEIPVKKIANQLSIDQSTIYKYLKNIK